MLLLSGFPPELLLVLSAALFLTGLVGVLVRRNILVLMMCVELMLNAANLAFVTFGKAHGVLAGEMSVFFVITVAAAEAAVGLGLLIALYRTLRTVDTDQIQLLRD